MNPTTKTILEALKSSPNIATAQTAATILAGGTPTFSPLPASELALMGGYGGFMKAVMTGDLKDMWDLADELNRTAITHLIPAEFKKP